MALSQVMRRLESKPGEECEAYDGERRFHYDYFAPTKRSDSEETIIITPGWLGSFTFNGVARCLADTGKHVAVVRHTDNSLDSLFHPNHTRSKRVHAVSKAVVSKVGDKNITYVDHSNGNRDVVASIEYQFGKDPDELNYNVRRLVSVDGVGSNGKIINPLRVVNELSPHVELMQSNLKSYARVVGISVLNLIRNPALASIEGVSTIHFDARPTMQSIEQSGVEVDWVFHEDDKIIIPPEDNPRALILPGGHLATPTNPDTLLHVVAR